MRTPDTAQFLARIHFSKPSFFGIHIRRSSLILIATTTTLTLTLATYFLWQSANAAPWTTITQRHGVIQNDTNGTILTSHTAQLGERMRVRFQIDTSSGDQTRNLGLKLQYDKNDNSWQDVRPAGDLRPAQSTTIGLSTTTGTGTAGSCQGGTTKIPGLQTNHTAKTPTLILPSATCQDIAFIIDTANATPSTTYRLRLYDQLNATTLNSYAAYPTFTTSSSTTKITKANLNSLPTGTQDLKHYLDAQGYSNIAANDSATDLLQNRVNDTTADYTFTGSSGEGLGLPISIVKDVNGDGYDDLLIASPTYNSSTGRVQLYFGGPKLASSPDLTFAGSEAGDLFGVGASSAGDVNGDGYNDIVIGAMAHSIGSKSNRGYIYFGGPNMDNVADVTLTAGTVGDFPAPLPIVSGIGDFNGDGYDDVLLGDPIYNTSAGRSLLYYGGPSMDNTADLTFSTASSPVQGIMLAPLGDINGDGYDDIGIGAVGYVRIYYGGSSPNSTVDLSLGSGGVNAMIGSGVGDINGDGYSDFAMADASYSTNTGRVYLYYGGATPDNTVDITITGTANSTLGAGLQRLDDINGDGYADIAVGAVGYSSNTGQVYIYYGGASMDTTADITLTGEATNNYFGQLLSPVAGDLNGDGFPDLAIGAYGHSSSNGKAYIYHLSHSLSLANPISINTPAISFGDVNGDGLIDKVTTDTSYSSNTGRAYIYYGTPSGYRPTANVTITGPATGSEFGTNSAALGDINGDGYSDIVVAAPKHSSNQGTVYIFYGGPSLSASIAASSANVIISGNGNQFGSVIRAHSDFNGDGYSDIIISKQPASGLTVFYLFYGGDNLPSTLTQANASATSSILSGAFLNPGLSTPVDSSDLNGDGYHDLVFAGFQGDAGDYVDDEVYVCYGGPSFSLAPSLTLPNPSPGAGLTVGPYGLSVGDINGDGYSDLIAGYIMVFPTQAGTVSVYLGGSPPQTVAALTLPKTGSALGFNTTVGDLNGDGYDDVIIGDYGGGGFATQIHYGAPSLSSTPDLSSSSLLCMFALDKNQDGLDDLICTDGGSSGVELYGGQSEAIPTYQLAQTHTTTCSGLTNITIDWSGTSTVSASSKSVTLEAYRYGSTNAWQTLATNNSTAAGSTITFNHSISANRDEYCDPNNQVHVRVSQAKGTQTLATNQFTLQIEGGSGPTPTPSPTPTPALNQLMRGGQWFLSGVKQPFNFIRKQGD